MSKGTPARPGRPARPLLQCLAELKPRLARAARLAVFLDYDGTLTRIARRPADALLRDSARSALRSLSRRSGVRVAIISGRSLRDVRSLVGVRGLTYAGCHGLEIVGPRLVFSEPRAARFRPAVREAARRLAASLRCVAGVEVEDKGLTVAVHFRRADGSAKSAAARAARDAVHAHNGALRLSRGKEVSEILPNVDWNKGRAVRWILAHAGNGRALPVYIGDDVTDEDAFAALRGGITVRAGRSAPTSARYTVPGPAAVEAFLHWLDRVRE
ncbi:MAG: trehalose-phosphatase [Bryobacteraceae bacterium]